MKNCNTTLLLSLLCICGIAGAGFAGKNSTLVLQNADFNRNSLVNGQLVSVLEGNVVFEYDDAIIRSDRATWYRKSGEAHFTGHINVTQRQQLLSCDQMQFSRDQKKLVAQRNIDFFDAKKQIRLKAQHAEYFLNRRHLTLTKSPQLIQYDTARAETLSIVGEKMIYDDSLQIAIAEKNVVMNKGLLRSTCQNATYFLALDIAKLRTDPWIYYDIHELSGDSVDLLFLDDALRGVSVMRNAKGFHRDISKRDTIFTAVTGDSLYMSISDSGNIETIWTYRDAKTLYYSSKNPQLQNEGIGKVMILRFVHGATGTLNIAGNADCIYYLNQENESGKNEANGDEIFITFYDGKAEYIKMTGSVRGAYYAERIK